MQQQAEAMQQQSEMGMSQAKTMTEMNQPENQEVMEEAMNQVQSLEEDTEE